MNRQERRLAERNGSVEADPSLDEPVALPAGSGRRGGDGAGSGVDGFGERGRSAGGPRRGNPRTFLHEVNVELRKVAWPSRSEVANYATVVFVALAVLMALIFGLDLGFSKLANFLFK